MNLCQLGFQAKDRDFRSDVLVQLNQSAEISSFYLTILATEITFFKTQFVVKLQSQLHTPPFHGTKLLL